MKSLHQDRVTSFIQDLQNDPLNAFPLALNFVIGELRARTSNERLTLLTEEMVEKVLAVLPKKSGLTLDQLIKDKLKDSAPIFIDDLIKSSVLVTGVKVPMQSRTLLVNNQPQMKDTDGAYQAINVIIKHVANALSAGINLASNPNDGLEGRAKRLKDTALELGLSEDTATMLEKLAEAQIAFATDRGSVVLSLDKNGRIRASRLTGSADSVSYLVGVSE